MAQHLKLERRNGIALIVLDRPERRNAVTLDMWREIPVMIGTLEQEPGVRGIVLTGAGKHFCAGADISEFDVVRGDARQAASYEEAVDRCCDALFATPKPTIAALRGACMGGACNLAMACDFRFAAPGALFGIPAARLSIVYGVKGTQRLLTLVGLPNAKRIFFTAEPVDAEEAFRIGLVDRVVADPLEEALGFLSRIAANAPLTIAGAKRLLNGMATTLGGLDPEVARTIIRCAVESEDYRESVRAFGEKRAPVFQGR